VGDVEVVLRGRLASLSLEHKVGLPTGADFWSLHPDPGSPPRGPEKPSRRRVRVRRQLPRPGDPGKEPRQQARDQRTTEVYERLFGPLGTSKPDPELSKILRGLIFGDVFAVGDRNDRTREPVEELLPDVLEGRKEPAIGCRTATRRWPT
jgi:hypothetical protein